MVLTAIVVIITVIIVRIVFSLFTAAPQQRAIRATKLLTEMRIITGWTWQFSYSSLSKYMYRSSHLEASNASGECGTGCRATSK